MDMKIAVIHKGKRTFNLLMILMAVDVVCGMEVDEKSSKYKSVYQGKTYYFCGPMCKLEFDENPQKYVTP